MKYFKCIIILLIVAIVGCEEENRIDFIPGEGAAPAPVSIKEVIPRTGGAVIKFNAPDDVNFFYAKAVYDIREGVTRETMASVYTDSLVIEGYGDTKEHTVKIFSVGKNNMVSDQSVTVNLTPLKPAIINAIETLTIKEGFGGITIRYNNPSSSDLIFEVYMDTTNIVVSETVDWTILETFYTDQAIGKLTVRDLETKETLFGVRVRDPYNNQSEMMTATLIPLFEQMIPKVGYRDMLLSDRCVYYNAATFLTSLWNNDWSTSINDFWASDQQGLPMPKSIAIDVGVSSVLSRVRWFHRYNYEWRHGTPTKWELYGSNENVADWDKWTLIQQFGPEYKPSGLPHGQRTQEDIDFIRANGCNFDIDLPKGPFRYYKIKFMEMSDGGSFILLKEIEFLGSIEGN